MAETVCAIRNPRLSGPGRWLRNSQRIPTMSANEAKKPTTGETTIGIRIFSRMPSHFTVMPPAMAAPIRPPNRACEDELGSPKYHVSRFQVMAPTSAPITTTSPC